MLSCAPACTTLPTDDAGSACPQPAISHPQHVDDVTRANMSISSKRAARELTMIVGVCGKLQMIVSDDGTGFTSNATLMWAKDHDVNWHYIAPTDAEQLHRVVQRPHARRASQREPVHRSRSARWLIDRRNCIG
jgi:hypothetical protein